ncbi:MAG: 30S ribosomal protein S4 [Nitrososphaerota archaeon]|jgi:small subunit ribosomal protein S4|nr:30S ribosomal protein S4 [Nitrososphaerota archaeon]MDG7040158.1 30S ribosomal protein S4 [Nitrososphaerota archaeon]MDG7041658.1 30S ribosomal protein S4 [Nitrososphaerota archaeon]MDG7043307.1 30S ribosomal protein S4 [Nitrososphaerota archaeon]MDG7045505.1 30S ribosomal protein S4 [Nitrososphaerota archaeon]
MGDPKKPRKKYNTLRNPWDQTELINELKIIGEYGLRNKHELWKASTELSRIRSQARQLLAAPTDRRAKVEKQFLNSLEKMGLLTTDKSLDATLNLSVQDLLNRRLQTVVWKGNLAKSPYEARQLIVHRHIMVGERIVNRPGYVVKGEEEKLIKPLIDANHGAEKGAA